jgi:hypothetical protein
VKKSNKWNDSKGEYSAKGGYQQIRTSHRAVYVTNAHTEGEMKYAKLIHCVRPDIIMGVGNAVC